MDTQPNRKSAIRQFVIRKFLHDYFDLHRSKEDEDKTITSIRNGVEMKGTTLWVLICAIFIASLGLNVNSTAVIIGAMLISPLMGPIMGIGLAVGINDFELLKRSIKSYLVTTAFSVITATLYFSFTPLTEVQSELLARTSPTIYDVFIALVGGIAGIIALATKEKGNVLPGVAIATALMPPLCTAGFGLATGNLYYFLGAFYLYFINTVFISLATFVGVVALHFHQKEFTDNARKRTVRRYIFLITIVTMAPALYLTFGIVKATLYNSTANDFINKELKFTDTQVLNRTIDYKERTITVVLIGKEVSENEIATARNKLVDYRLPDTRLTVYQGGGGHNLSLNSIRSTMLGDVYLNSERRIAQQQHQIDSLREVIDEYTRSTQIDSRLTGELKVLFPNVQSISLNKTVLIDVDTHKPDTIIYAMVSYKRNESPAVKNKLRDWLSARTGEDKLRVISQ